MYRKLLMVLLSGAIAMTMAGTATAAEADGEVCAALGSGLQGPVKVTYSCDYTDGKVSGWVNVEVTGPQGEPITNQTVPIGPTGSNAGTSSPPVGWGTYGGELSVLPYCWIYVPFYGCADAVTVPFTKAYVDAMSAGYSFDAYVYGIGGTTTVYGTCTDPLAANGQSHCAQDGQAPSVEFTQ